MSVLEHSEISYSSFDMKKNISRLALAVPALCACGSALAAGEGDTVASSVIDQAQSSLEGILTSAGSAVTALVVAGLAIWGAIAIVGVLKRAFSAGKGR